MRRINVTYKDRYKCDIMNNEDTGQQGQVLDNMYITKKMAENIAAKVLTMDRSLERKSKSSAPNEPPSAVPIRVISNFGSDTDLVNVVQKYEPHSIHVYPRYVQN